MALVLPPLLLFVRLWKTIGTLASMLSAVCFQWLFGWWVPDLEHVQHRTSVGVGIWKGMEDESLRRELAITDRWDMKEPSGMAAQGPR